MLKYSRGHVFRLRAGKLVKRDYGALPSPGTVYLKLYSLERKDLIRSTRQGTGGVLTD